MESNYNVKINLAAFKHVVRKMKSKNGDQECLIIPLASNHLFKGDKGLYVDITAIAVKEPKFDDTHILKQGLPKEIYDALTDEQKKAQPIFGNMGPWKSGKNEASVVTDAGSDDDELPF